MSVADDKDDDAVASPPTDPLFPLIRAERALMPPPVPPLPIAVDELPVVSVLVISESVDDVLRGCDAAVFWILTAMMVGRTGVGCACVSTHKTKPEMH